MRSTMWPSTPRVLRRKDIALRWGRPPPGLGHGREQMVTLADGRCSARRARHRDSGLRSGVFHRFPDLDGIRVPGRSTRAWHCALFIRCTARRGGGAGFIGCVVAVSLRGLGVDVVLVERTGAVGLGAGRADRPAGDAAPSR